MPWKENEARLKEMIPKKETGSQRKGRKRSPWKKEGKESSGKRRN